MSTNDLPTRVREERKRRRWTQKDMAAKTGMSLRAYQGFESRSTSPQGANLRAILAAVEIDTTQEEIAEATREDWPRDIRVFLDMMGAYLATMPDEDRLAVMSAMTRRIFNGT
jgi:transcriptional regulator with XRE-family HTH domain